MHKQKHPSRIDRVESAYTLIGFGAHTACVCVCVFPICFPLSSFADCIDQTPTHTHTHKSKTKNTSILISDICSGSISRKSATTMGAAHIYTYISCDDHTRVMHMLTFSNQKYAQINYGRSVWDAQRLDARRMFVCVCICVRSVSTPYHHILMWDVQRVRYAPRITYSITQFAMRTHMIHTHIRVNGGRCPRAFLPSAECVIYSDISFCWGIRKKLCMIFAVCAHLLPNCKQIKRRTNG